MGKKNSFDITQPYVRRARLEPALIVALPLPVAILAWFPGGILGWGALWSLIVWCGGTALLAQIARDSGKQKEPTLFQSWGGKPTTRLLRHRGAANKILLQRRHQKLQALVPGVRLPTAEQEAADPQSADDTYDACTAFLLEKTRDTKKFSLLFDENCNYGFRRNLWGMKLMGIAVSLCGFVSVVVLVVAGLFRTTTPSPFALVCGAINALLLVGWLTWFTPAWVKLAADAYAERLLASCEAL